MRIDTNPSALRQGITNTEIRTDHVEAFHAMMLCPSLVAELELNRFITPEYAPQRR